MLPVKERYVFLTKLENFQKGLLSENEQNQLRNEIFDITKRDITKVRLWFDSDLKHITLTKEELKTIEKLYYKNWEIINNIILNQPLSIDKKIELFDLVGKKRKGNRSFLWFTMLKQSISNELKLQIFNEILNYNNVNYHRALIHYFNEHPNYFFKDFLISLFRRLDLGEFSEIVKIWNNIEIPNLEIFCKKNKIYSLKLYEITKKECYISPEMKEVFIW